MTTIPELLDALGRAAWAPVWAPTLAWTAFAAPLWLALERTDRVHPRAEYRLLQVLLGTLPLGILAVAGGTLLPDAMAIAPTRSFSLTVLPSGPPPDVTTSSGFAWRWFPIVGLATGVAGAVALVRLGRLALDACAALRVRWALDGAVSPSLQDRAARIARRLGAHRHPRTVLTDEVSVPLTLGGLRPLVLLPPALADDTDALRMTLLHECIHVRRYDDLAHLLERFVGALFAAHPLVGRLQRSIAGARERACDAAVLDRPRTSAADYARLLVAVADGRPLRGLRALSLSESPTNLTSRLRTMRSTVSRWLSSSFSLGAAAATVGLSLLFGVVACSDSVAPTSSPSPEAASSASASPEALSTVDRPPTIKGGQAALQDAIQYPDLAREAGIQGRVLVRFVVGASGTPRDVRVKRSVHPALDSAAVQALRSVSFTPARKEGRAVPTNMVLPVTFRLPDAPSSETASGTPTEAGLDEIKFHDLPSRKQNQLLAAGPVFEAATRTALSSDLSYPKLIRKAGIEGTVEVTFTLGADGTPQEARVTNPLHDALDAQALRSVQTTTFATTDRAPDLAGEKISVRFAYGPPGE